MSRQFTADPGRSLMEADLGEERFAFKVLRDCLNKLTEKVNCNIACFFFSFSFFLFFFFLFFFRGGGGGGGEVGAGRE